MFFVIKVPEADSTVPDKSLTSSSVDAPSGAVEMPSGELPGTGARMPSIGGDMTGEKEKGGEGSSLFGGIASGVSATVGAAASAVGLAGGNDKAEGEVRRCPYLFLSGWVRLHAWRRRELCAVEFEF